MLIAVRSKRVCLIIKENYYVQVFDLLIFFYFNAGLGW